MAAWEIEYTDAYGQWFDELSLDEADSVDTSVAMLQQLGPRLGYPHSSGIKGSKHSHLRELRVQHAGRPYRVFYAFNPLRTALLLIGGDKTGDNRFYERMIPIADALYAEHLIELRKEGNL